MSIMKDLRTKFGKKQSEIADLLGITRAAYTNIENGRRKLDHDSLIKLADYYGVTIDYLLGRDSEQKNNPDAAGTGDDEIYSILSELTPENQEKLLELARMYRASQQPPEDK